MCKIFNKHVVNYVNSNVQRDRPALHSKSCHTDISRVQSQAILRYYKYNNRPLSPLHVKQHIAVDSAVQQQTKSDQISI